MSTSPRLTYNITEVSPLKEIPDRKETSVHVQRPFSVLNDILRRIPVVGSALDSALQQLDNVIFPGNAPDTKRGISYAALNEKITTRQGSYEPLSPDVRHYTLATPLGNSVGIHVYPAKGPITQVVIAHHGNVRPPRYMNRELEALTNGRTRVVIAVDFIGYDLSSRVPNKGGALEIASIINDTIAYQYATEEYPDAREVIYFGRSLGNFGWGHCIQFPKVTKVIACVPFGDLHTVVGRFLSSMAPQNSFARWIVTAVQHIIVGQILGAAFPSGSRVDDLPGAQTRGFSLASMIDALVGPMSGKSVLLMKASEDELIPDGEADRLAAKLEEKGIKTKVMALTGSHHALPWDAENKGFAPAAMEDFFANGL